MEIDTQLWWLGFQLAKVRIVVTLLSGSGHPACVKALFINQCNVTWSDGHFWVICCKPSLFELVDRTDVDWRRHGLHSFLHIVFTAISLAHREFTDQSDQGAQRGRTLVMK